MDPYYSRFIAIALYQGVCVIALLRGDRPLKATGAAIIINSLVAPVVQRHAHLNEPQYGVLAVDAVLLVALALILLRDRRWWLVVATALLMMSTFTHLAALIGSPINPKITAYARLFWAFGMIAAVGWGVVMRERRRHDSRPAAVATVRSLIAEHGEARTRAELDRRYLVASDPVEKADAARLVQALKQLTLTQTRDGAM
jgi:hypothetical protein